MLQQSSKNDAGALDVYLNNEIYVPEKGTYNEKYNFNPAEYVFNMSAEEFFTTANALMIKILPHRMTLKYWKK